ncbi:oleate delta-12 desaturase [Nemania abortiva]|nr:oleate delta-12 desaturase [Nemania abortiva]
MSSMKTSEPANELIDGYGNVFKIPDYTMHDIHKAIPKHCYERSTIKGISYVLRDVASTYFVFRLFYTFVTPDNIPSTPVRTLLWGLYTFIQGLFGLGLWVLGHECSHQTLTASKALNDTIGFLLHSALFSPYFSWTITHRRHHRFHNNMVEDVVWNPPTREEYASLLGKLSHEISEIGEETPIVSLLWLIAQQTVGWPNYLITNVTGHKFLGKQNGLFTGANHFSPASPFFKPKDAKLILLSDLGLAATVLCLVYLSRACGWVNLLVWYFLPYLWVNNWIAAITFLHHTDPSVPRYTPALWTYTLGAAATIDRDFGFIGKHIFHGIIETHVLHHSVTTIPFYHAFEATEAIKLVMGRHYRSDTERGPMGFIRAVWRNLRWCQWVEPAEGARRDVLFFRNRNGLGTQPMKLQRQVARGN